MSQQHAINPTTRIAPQMDCPYCSLDALDPRVVFKEELVRFVQDRRYQGALKHSGIIIPVAHRETLFDLTHGFNVGWNCGRVGGQEVFHAHLHVIPRFRQEPLAGQGIRAHLKSEANRW
jgi:hypothetical protein